MHSGGIEDFVNVSLYVFLNHFCTPRSPKQILDDDCSRVCCNSLHEIVPTCQKCSPYRLPTIVSLDFNCRLEFFPCPFSLWANTINDLIVSSMNLCSGWDYWDTSFDDRWGRKTEDHFFIWVLLSTPLRNIMCDCRDVRQNLTKLSVAFPSDKCDSIA